MTTSAQSDGLRYRWGIVTYGFLALALAFSARAALGLVMPVWQQELGWTRSFVSGVGGCALVAMACIAPFAGWLMDKKGPRFVISLGLVALSSGCFVIAGANDELIFAVAFGGLCAIGFGTIAAHTISTAVAREFVHKPGLPIGVATSGATAGQFLIVPLIAAVLTFASWRWSCVGLGTASALLALVFLWQSGLSQSASIDRTPANLLPLSSAISGSSYAAAHSTCCSGALLSADSPPLE